MMITIIEIEGVDDYLNFVDSVEVFQGWLPSSFIGVGSLV